MLSRARRRPGRGFTLVEIVVAVIILGMLAAALYPTIAAQLRHGQSAALGAQLDAVREAAANYHENVRAHPRLLAQLTTQPPPGAVDLCGVALSNPERNRWRGPYLDKTVLGDLPAADATVRDTILRNPVTNAITEPGLMQVRALNVDSAIAADLEAQFDGSADYGTGTILWVPTGAQIGTLTFQIPIRGC